MRHVITVVAGSICVVAGVVMVLVHDSLWGIGIGAIGAAAILLYD